MNIFLGKNHPKQEKIKKLSKNTGLISKEKSVCRQYRGNKGKKT